MKIELNVVGLQQTLSFETGDVTNVALIQNESGETVELPVSEAFAARLVEAHASRRPALPASRHPGVSRKTQPETPSAKDAAIAHVGALIQRIEDDADYELTADDFALLDATGLDLASLVAAGEIVPGRNTQGEREFSMPEQDDETTGGEVPTMGSLLGSEAEEPAEEEADTKRVAADLRNKARRRPGPPRTVPHDEAGNPVVPQVEVAASRKRGGSRDDDLFGQG